MFLHLILAGMLIAEPASQNLRWNFQQDAVGALPRGWSERGGAATETYRI